MFKPYVGTETVSWVCILGVAPFVAFGFVKYNGMTVENNLCVDKVRVFYAEEVGILFH